MNNEVKFEVKGLDLTNIKIGDIVNMELYSKDTHQDNIWEHINCSWDKDRDYEVINITKINNKYIKLKLQRTTPCTGRNGKVSYYPKTRIVFGMDGVSKTQYCNSAPGYSWKRVITTIK